MALSDDAQYVQISILIDVVDHRIEGAGTSAQVAANRLFIRFDGEPRQRSVGIVAEAG